MGALEQVRDLARAVVERRSLDLWDVEMGGPSGRTVVRVYVDGPRGVDLGVLAEVSEEISRGLDLRDPIPGRYTLEVSTPGLERALSSPEHFRACVGRKVVMKTKERLVGDSHRIEGIIADVGEEAVRVGFDEGTVEVHYDAIRSARTVFEWS